MTFSEHMENFSEGAFYTGCRDWDMEAGVSRAILDVFSAYFITSLKVTSNHC